ncbi:MAG: hypothetical protein M3278_04230 [Thermoproteota archaeon]|nr:hypothetical protein [Thermoproteota archaeon]
MACSFRNQKQDKNEKIYKKEKKKNLLIVQFVYCEYVLSLDGFSDSIC